MTRKYLNLLLIAFAAVLIAACGGDDEDPDPTATPPASTGAEATGSTGSGITSFTEVQPAVIQVVSQGTFRDPELGLSDASGAGSGFIISADGLAITNNHVVAGAATIEVFIGGDNSRGYNASIVGVSECNDLALIDIRSSQPLPYLDWYQGSITPGTDVYTAGFPLGDPEYTLTRGIVSKARADGEAPWSSIDFSVEHDATIQGGNSGGPLVTTDGKVLGVNYASKFGTDSSIFYAIPSAIAQDVTEQLMDGDYESIGINGWAVFDEKLNISGIWVAGVAAGSPAAKARILPGDIIMALNGLPMALDGTMKDYCDVFRTHGDDRPMTVEVLRYDTGETLRGEINGDGPIEVAFSPATEIQGVVDSTPTGGATTYDAYQSITDDTNTIIVDVPVEWKSIATTPCNVDNVEVPCVTAAVDIDSFQRYDFSTSGMVFALFGPMDDLEDLLDRYAPGACDYFGTYDYTDPVFTGLYDIWENCNGLPTVYVVLSAVPANNAYTALLIVQIVIDADWDALDQLFNTFNVLR